MFGSPNSDNAQASEDPDNSSNQVFFPLLFKAAGIAAAIALVATLLWLNLPKDGEQMTERYAASESVVEFVDTGIPDAHAPAES